MLRFESRIPARIPHTDPDFPFQRNRQRWRFGKKFNVIYECRDIQSAALCRFNIYPLTLPQQRQRLNDNQLLLLDIF